MQPSLCLIKQSTQALCTIINAHRTLCPRYCFYCSNSKIFLNLIFFVFCKKKICVSGGGVCLKYFDGFYLLTFVTVTIGFIWLIFNKKIMAQLQSIPKSDWLISKQFLLFSVSFFYKLFATVFMSFYLCKNLFLFISRY